MHPGCAGKDATADFNDIGHTATAKELIPQCCIGDVSAATMDRFRRHAQPADFEGTRAGKRTLVLIDADDDADDPQEALRSTIKERGEGQRIRAKSMDKPCCNCNCSGDSGRGSAAIVPVRSPESSWRPPVPVLRTPKPDVMIIDDDDDDDTLEEVLLIGGRGEGVVRGKAEPSHCSGSDSEDLGAGGRALVPAAAAKRKRGRKPSTNAQTPGVGVRETSLIAKARSSRGKMNSWGGGMRNQSSSAFASSAKSSGAPDRARGKGRARSGQISQDIARSGAPVSRVGSVVASRTRSGSSEQRRVQCASDEVVISEEEEEPEVEAKANEEEEEEEEEEVIGAEVQVVEGCSDANGNGNGEIEDKSKGRGMRGDVEKAEEKESGADEDGIDHDSDDSFEGDVDEEESEEDEEESDEAWDDPEKAGDELSPCSGDRETQFIEKRMFEGLCFPKQVDTADGKSIKLRTRSNFKHVKLLDRKLLKRGTFSKPYCIDASESSSEPEEDMPQLEQTQNLSSYNWDFEEHITVTKRRSHTGQNAYSDAENDTTFVCSVRRQKGTSSYYLASKEGCKKNDDPTLHVRNKKNDGSTPNFRSKKNDGSTPQQVRNNGPAVRRQTERLDGQSDISFKKNAYIAHKRKHGRAVANQETYDNLLNAIFDEIESHRYESVSANEQNDNRLPLLFSFGDEDGLDEKSELNKSQDEMWTEHDFALESINLCCHNCEEGEKNNEQQISADKATSCRQGEHELFIDEQIGVRCKHCHFVDVEIRYVLPSMVRSCMERDPKKDRELELIFDDILTSTGYEGPHNFDGHKTGLVWDLIPGVREDMFPHQREGFEFIWRKLAGGISIEQLKHTVNSIEGGCVISHAPGTGKTRLAITFVQSYFELFPQSCPVIIAPKGMLATWEQEFRKWKVKVPFHVLNFTEIHWNEDKTIQDMATMDENLAQCLTRNKLDEKFRRKMKLASWRKGSSIIGVSYSLFRKLANHECMDGFRVRNLLLERPDLLVLDEGHTPRNKKSLIWKVLAEVRTEKRIILSGTPFQNNFLELYNILNLVRPKFAGDFVSASKRTNQSRATPQFGSKRDMLLDKDESKDFWTSLTLNNITEENIDEIRKLLDPIVHIHNGDILQKSLPGLRESVVILNPLPHQKEIITTMENTVAMGALDAEYKISLASIHPYLITCAKLSEKEASAVNVSFLKSLRPNPCEGVKTRFVLEIVRLCEAMKERVLVFSQYLEPLSLIMNQLSKMFNWSEGKEILLMSGNVQIKNRETLMEAFNDMNSQAKVMLASTKACCEGITLIGASRVVLLDVVWNPSVGRQAIGRAYRIGQEKIVYTYNLIAEGTKEKDKYDRQSRKDQMSKLLFSKEPQPAMFNLSQEVTFNDKIMEAMTEHRELKDMFVKILPSH
ncbi:hypothetical protein ABZP36_031425 [Zizania latifolia]